jgi:hypothetical protein
MDWRRQQSRLKQLGPYQSLAILLLPLAIVEPLKLFALFVAGEGHWMTATVIIIISYLGSVLLVERLYRAVKPKLMQLSWFSAGLIFSQTLYEVSWRSLSRWWEARRLRNR